MLVALMHLHCFAPGSPPLVGVLPLSAQEPLPGIPRRFSRIEHERLCVYVCMCVCVYVCVCLRMPVYVCVCLCMRLRV